MSRGATASPQTAAALHGAWSLSGQPLESLPDAGRLAALLAGDGLMTVKSKCLWLAAAPDRLVRRGDACLAWDGWLAAAGDGAWQLEERLRGRAVRADSGPPGHYVAVLADPVRGELVLMRDPSGGERLYFAEAGGALFFSCSWRRLAAVCGSAAVLDEEAALERGLSELVHFGDRTLVAGVREVLPGRRAWLDGARVVQRWAWEGLLEPAEGDEEALARGLRAALTREIERCLPPDGRAAVALSGGLDSSAVAALAARVAGPDRIEAFTIEYAHPGHPSEAPYARKVCAALGLRPPTIVRLAVSDVLDAAPEGVWLTEDPRYWKRAYPMALARAAAQAGHDRFLSGFGVGSHMAYLDDFAAVAPWLPAPALRAWAASRRPFPGAGGPGAWLHPGLERPMSRLVFPLVAVLRRRGARWRAGDLYPAELAPLVDRLVESARVREALEESAAWPLSRQLAFACFTAMNSCVDVARCERAAREVGAHWLGPAHFPSVLPYCYLPPARRSRFGPRARPGKRPLARAMRGLLPDDIIDRPKYWPHANGPAEWRDASLAAMERAAGRSWDPLRELFGPAFETLRRLSPEGMIPLAFWHRVCVEGRFSSPPSWSDLE